MNNNFKIFNLLKYLYLLCYFTGGFILGIVTLVIQNDPNERIDISILCLTFIAIVIKLILISRQISFKTFFKMQLSFIIPYLFTAINIFMYYQTLQFLNDAFFDQVSYNVEITVLTSLELFLTNLIASLICNKKTSSKVQYWVFMTVIAFSALRNTYTTWQGLRDISRGSDIVSDNINNLQIGFVIEEINGTQYVQYLEAFVQQQYNYECISDLYLAMVASVIAGQLIVMDMIARPLQKKQFKDQVIEHINELDQTDALYTQQPSSRSSKNSKRQVNEQSLNKAGNQTLKSKLTKIQNPKSVHSIQLHELNKKNAQTSIRNINLLSNQQRTSLKQSPNTQGLIKRIIKSRKLWINVYLTLFFISAGVMMILYQVLVLSPYILQYISISLIFLSFLIKIVLTSNTLSMKQFLSTQKQFIIPYLIVAGTICIQVSHYIQLADLQNNIFSLNSQNVVIDSLSYFFIVVVCSLISDRKNTTKKQRWGFTLVLIMAVVRVAYLTVQRIITWNQNLIIILDTNRSVNKVNYQINATDYQTYQQNQEQMTVESSTIDVVKNLAIVYITLMMANYMLLLDFIARPFQKQQLQQQIFKQAVQNKQFKEEGSKPLIQKQQKQNNADRNKDMHAQNIEKNFKTRNTELIENIRESDLLFQKKEIQLLNKKRLTK